MKSSNLSWEEVCSTQETSYNTRNFALLYEQGDVCLPYGFPKFLIVKYFQHMHTKEPKHYNHLVIEMKKATAENSDTWHRKWYK